MRPPREKLLEEHDTGLAIGGSGGKRTKKLGDPIKKEKTWKQIATQASPNSCKSLVTRSPSPLACKNNKPGNMIANSIAAPVSSKS